MFPAFIEALLKVSDYQLNPLVRIRFTSLAGHSGVNSKFLKYRSNIKELNFFYS